MKSSLLLLAGLTALSPLTGAGLAAPVMADSTTAFSPPTAPLMLSRTVIRELSDGKQIVVTRSFKVQFVNADSGFTLTGAPVSVTVDVPPVLAPMADLERKRSEPGPFPLAIDSLGLIQQPTSADASELQERQKAKLVASGLIEAGNGTDQSKRESIQILGNMASDPRNSPWPADLFTAKDAERHLHRSVALADGSQGEIDVILRVSKRLPCGMPALFERVITTDVAGTRRVSREVWSLEPIAAK